MKSRFVVFSFSVILLMLFLFDGLSFSAEPLTDTEIRELTDNIKRMYENHVYTVNAWSRITGDNYGRKTKGKATRWRRNVGTAFPLDERGYLITSLCVVRKAEKVSVVSRSGEETAANIVGSDTFWEIAILKIITLSHHVSPPVTHWNSIHEGNRVVLLGIPEENTLTAKPGTISGIHDSNWSITVSVYGKPGTTGTPVFDTGAQLLGILTYHVKDKNQPEKISSDGQSNYLVIPMEYASVIAQSIINSAEKSRGWLGIRIKFDTKGINDHRGIVIHHIVEDSPACRCGLRDLDRIIEYNGSPISTVHEMYEAASTTIVGDTITIKVLRKGSVLSLDAILSEHPGIK